MQENVVAGITLTATVRVLHPLAIDSQPCIVHGVPAFLNAINGGGHVRAVEVATCDTGQDHLYCRVGTAEHLDWMGLRSAPKHWHARL